MFGFLALDISESEQKNDLPLTPRHLHLAYESLYQKGKLFPAFPRKNVFDLK